MTPSILVPTLLGQTIEVLHGTVDDDLETTVRLDDGIHVG